MGTQVVPKVGKDRPPQTALEAVFRLRNRKAMMKELMSGTRQKPLLMPKNISPACAVGG